MCGPPTPDSLCKIFGVNRPSTPYDRLCRFQSKGAPFFHPSCVQNIASRPSLPFPPLETPFCREEDSCPSSSSLAKGRILPNPAYSVRLLRGCPPRPLLPSGIPIRWSPLARRLAFGQVAWHGVCPRHGTGCYGSHLPGFLVSILGLYALMPQPNLRDLLGRLLGRWFFHRAVDLGRLTRISVFRRFCLDGGDRLKNADHRLPASGEGHLRRPFDSGPDSEKGQLNLFVACELRESRKGW